MLDLNPDREATIRTFLARFDALLERFTQNQRGIEDAQTYIANTNAEQDRIRADAEKLREAGDLFGFDIYQELDRRAAELVDQINGDLWAVEAPVVDAAAAATLAAMSDTPKFDMTIKDFILSEAGRDYPEPVRAADLRRRLINQYGVTVHEKTFGMTLYRLSKETPPRMRRQGKQDWCRRPPPPTNGRRRSSSVSYADGGMVARDSLAGVPTGVRFPPSPLFFVTAAKPGRSPPGQPLKLGPRPRQEHPVWQTRTIA